MSSDFFEILLPNPVLSEVVVEVLTGLRIATSEICETFRVSPCPLVCAWPLEAASITLPLVMTGEDCLRCTLTGPKFSAFPCTVTAMPGRDLPAETGLSGRVVLKFGGVSSG